VGRIKQILDFSDQKQARVASKLTAISDDLSKLDENSDLLQIIKDTVVMSGNALHAMNHAAILRSLRPATAGQRFDEIHDPEADTFSWILEESKPREPFQNAVFQQWKTWLTEGSGVFHITGKPGSGKSTLMKLLVRHSTTRSRLEQWASADGKQLLLSSFFFWKIGDTEQKTMRGLLRGILYEVIKETPEVTKMVFPEHWTPTQFATRQTRDLSLSADEVNKAFERLIHRSEVFAKFKICLFIDGLDEFDEPVKSLSASSNDINKWAMNPNLKLCLSSREEEPILRAFTSSQRIRLHTLTRPDVDALIHDKLVCNLKFQSLAALDTETARRLENTISYNAEGVFLWVVLCKGSSSVGTGEGPESRLTIYEREKERKTIYKRPSSQEYGLYS